MSIHYSLSVQKDFEEECTFVPQSQQEPLVSAGHTGAVPRVPPPWAMGGRCPPPSNRPYPTMLPGNVGARRWCRCCGSPKCQLECSGHVCGWGTWGSKPCPPSSWLPQVSIIFFVSKFQFHLILLAMALNWSHPFCLRPIWLIQQPCSRSDVTSLFFSMNQRQMFRSGMCQTCQLSPLREEQHWPKIT